MAVGKTGTSLRQNSCAFQYKEAGGEWGEEHNGIAERCTLLLYCVTAPQSTQSEGSKDQSIDEQGWMKIIAKEGLLQ